MELKIIIDETRFKEVLEKELEAFDKDELKQIIRDGLVKCISHPDTFKSLFVREYNNYKGSYKDATDILRDAAKTINLTPAFDEFEKKACQWLIDNHSAVLSNLLVSMLIEGFSQRMLKSDFTDRLKYDLLSMLQRHD